MAHFAKIDENNIVTTVVVVDDADTQDENGNEVCSIGAAYLNAGLGGTWKQTSYNTRGNIHKLGGTPFRKNYAGKGYTYDSERDAFIHPKPFPSWTLDEDTCLWNAPTPHPDDGKRYKWDEDSQSWVEMG